MKKGLGITGTWQNKPMTEEKYIAYRNELIERRNSRRQHFGLAINYYDLRLEEIDMQYPEYKGIGKVFLK
jgi:hypothetical protein